MTPPDSHALPPEIAAPLAKLKEFAEKHCNGFPDCHAPHSAISALETAITALVRDGERYRFLLDHDLRGGDRGIREGVHPDVFGRWVDSAMTDAARAASTPTPKG